MLFAGSPWLCNLLVWPLSHLGDILDTIRIQTNGLVIVSPALYRKSYLCPLWYMGFPPFVGQKNCTTVNA